MTATRRSSNRMAMDDSAALPPQGSDDRRDDSDDEQQEPQEQSTRRSTRVKTAPVASKTEGSVAAESVGSAAGSGKRKRDNDGSPETGTNQKVSSPNEAESKKEAVRKSPRARNAPPSVSYNSDLSASDLDTKPAAKKPSASSSAKRKSVNNQRVLQQVAPMDEMEKMIAEVEKENPNLLECEEPLEPSKEPLVTADQALFNRRWERLYRELLVFKKVYGHTIVPKMHMENRSLAVFVGNQRKYKKKRDKGEESPMTDSRLKRLEAVGFVWDAKKHKDFWNIQANCDQAMELWEENFQMLLKYKEQIGDCLVPKVFPANQQLARWVGRQRQHFRFLREGKYSSLTEEKVKRLEDLGFVFDTRNRAMRRRNLYMRYAGRWDEYYTRLVEYREEHGHSSVPRRWKADQSLASWVQRQRHEFKLKRAGKYNHLTEYRMKKLEAVDFEFVKGPQKEIRGVEEDEILDVFDVDEEALKKKRILQGIRYESDGTSDESDGSNPKPKRARKSRRVAKEESEDEVTETDDDGEEEEEEDADEADEGEEEVADNDDEEGEDEDDDGDEDEKEGAAQKKKGKVVGRAKSSGRDFKAKRVEPRLSSKRTPQRAAAAKARQRPLPIRHRLLRGAPSPDKASKASDPSDDSEIEEATSKAKAEKTESEADSRADSDNEEMEEEKVEPEVKMEDDEEEEEDKADAAVEETIQEVEEATTDGAEVELPVDEAKTELPEDLQQVGEVQQVEENDSSAAAVLHNDDSKQQEVEEETEEIEILQDDIGPGISERASRKGAWQCSICSEDDFMSFVEAYVHEAQCSQFKTTGTLTI